MLVINLNAKFLFELKGSSETKQVHESDSVLDSLVISHLFYLQANRLYWNDDLSLHKDGGGERCNVDDPSVKSIWKINIGKNKIIIILKEVSKAYNLRLEVYQTRCWHLRGSVTQ